MRSRSKVVASLESLYREAFDQAAASDDAAHMEALDFRFQRDQVFLEVMLDIRDGLAHLAPQDSEDEPSLLDRARAIRKFTKLGAR